MGLLCRDDSVSSKKLCHTTNKVSLAITTNIPMEVVKEYPRSVRIFTKCFAVQTTIVDGNCVGHIITRNLYGARRASRSGQGQHRRDRNVEGTCVQCLKDILRVALGLPSDRLGGTFC